MLESSVSLPVGCSISASMTVSSRQIIYSAKNKTKIQQSTIKRRQQIDTTTVCQRSQQHITLWLQWRHWHWLWTVR